MSEGGDMKVKIGELAKMTGCEVVTIRYYEKEGLNGQKEIIVSTKMMILHDFVLFVIAGNMV